MLDLLQNAVRPGHVKPKFQVLMFPNSSDLFWGSCGKSIDTMSHEP